MQDGSGAFQIRVSSAHSDPSFDQESSEAVVVLSTLSGIQREAQESSDPPQSGLQTLIYMELAEANNFWIHPKRHISNRHMEKGDESWDPPQKWLDNFLGLVAEMMPTKL